MLEATFGNTMKFWRNLAILIASAISFSGCCHLPASSRFAKRPPLPPAVGEAFDYPKGGTITCQEKDAGGTPVYSIRRIDLPSAAAATSRSETNRALVMDYFVPRTAGKHPVLVILPMLGGSYPLEKYFASYFGKRGFASIIVHREKPPKDSGWEVLDAMFKQSVLDNRRAMDWIETRPELDARRIGVFGISMGAIKGALLTPLDPRIRAATLGLGGGDIPYILTYTTEHGISKRREAILREQHLSLPELREQLGQCIRCDPNAVAPFVDPAKVLLILGACDTVVPIKKGLELRQKMGKPETVIVPTGHYSAILCLPYIQRQCYKFFQKKLTVER